MELPMNNSIREDLETRVTHAEWKMVQLTERNMLSLKEHAIAALQLKHDGVHHVPGYMIPLSDDIEEEELLHNLKSAAVATLIRKEEILARAAEKAKAVREDLSKNLDATAAAQAAAQSKGSSAPQLRATAEPIGVWLTSAANLAALNSSLDLSAMKKELAPNEAISTGARGYPFAATMDILSELNADVAVRPQYKFILKAFEACQNATFPLQCAIAIQEVATILWYQMCAKEEGSSIDAALRSATHPVPLGVPLSTNAKFAAEIARIAERHPELEEKEYVARAAAAMLTALFEGDDLTKPAVAKLTLSSAKNAHPEAYLTILELLRKEAKKTGTRDAPRTDPAAETRATPCLQYLLASSCTGASCVGGEAHNNPLANDGSFTNSIAGYIGAVALNNPQAAIEMAKKLVGSSFTVIPRSQTKGNSGKGKGKPTHRGIRGKGAKSNGRGRSPRRNEPQAPPADEV